MGAVHGKCNRVGPPNRAEHVVDWVPLKEWVCLLQLRLQQRSLCVLPVYAPNMESQYEAFPAKHEVASGKVASSQSLVVFGDFNAHVGIDNPTWKGVIWQYCNPDIKKNRRCLLQLCATNEMWIINTCLQHQQMHKYTWYEDFLGQRSLIDFCIASADLFFSLYDVHGKRGAELSTDHHLVVCTLKPLTRGKAFRLRKTYRFKWEPLSDNEVRTAFADNIASTFYFQRTSHLF